VPVEPLDSVCAASVEDGHLAVLQWARENRCEWSSEASEGGHLTVLHSARVWDHGMWNHETVTQHFGPPISFRGNVVQLW
jgi:hypothetical protein